MKLYNTNTKKSSSSTTTTSSIMQMAYRSLVLPTRGKTKAFNKHRQLGESDETSVTSTTDFDPTVGTMMMTTEDNVHYAQIQPLKKAAKQRQTTKQGKQEGRGESKKKADKALINGTRVSRDDRVKNEGMDCGNGTAQHQRIHQDARSVAVPIPPADDAPIAARRLYRKQLREYHRSLELIRSQGIEQILVHDDSVNQKKKESKPTVVIDDNGVSSTIQPDTASTPSSKCYWEVSDQSKVGNKTRAVPKLEDEEDEHEDLSVIPILLCTKTSKAQKEAVMKAFDSWRATQDDVQESQVAVEQALKALKQAQRTLKKQQAAEKDARKLLQAVLYEGGRK